MNVRFLEAANEFNNNRLARSLSRYSAFGVSPLDLLDINSLLSEATSFLVGAAERPGLAAGRICCHVG